MNIAIVGSSGYMAGYLIKRFSDDENINIIKLDRTPGADFFIDLAEADQFDYNILDGIDMVLFMAAVVDQDKCAADFAFCWKIMVSGTEFFIRNLLDGFLQLEEPFHLFLLVSADNRETFLHYTQDKRIKLLETNVVSANIAGRILWQFFCQAALALIAFLVKPLQFFRLHICPLYIHRNIQP